MKAASGWVECPLRDIWVGSICCTEQEPAPNDNGATADLRMAKRLIIWDFDGTLADTAHLSLAIFNQLARERGFRPVDDPSTARRIPTREFLKRHGIRFWQAPGLMRIFLARLATAIAEVELFPRIPELLRALHARSREMGVLSSNCEANIRDCFERYGVASLFQFVDGQVSLFGKHRRLAGLCRAHKVPPSEVLYIGDEARDVEACRKAGIDMVAVTWGYHAVELLQSEQPTYLVDSVEQLHDLLQTV